jgi:hypothetical protein
MNLTKEQIEFLDKVVWGGRNNWTLNSKGEVDVEGSVDMSDMYLTEIPVKFGEVKGNFFCNRNKLTTLKNCPRIVNALNISDNNLTTLDYLPEKIVRFGLFIWGNPLKDYFNYVRVNGGFYHWDKIIWSSVIKEYPFLIKIAKNYVDKDEFIGFVKDYPKTKLYLR